jgi:hypothetical protein
MGLEGLVATIRSAEKLQAALVNELMKKDEKNLNWGASIEGK